MYRPPQHPGSRLPAPDSRFRRHRPREGFTLIEILITLFIIAALMAMLIAAAMRMREGSKAQQTKAVVQQVAGIISEFQAATKKVPNNRTPITRTGGAFAFSYASVDDQDSIRFLLEEVRNLPAAKTALGGVGPDFKIDDPPADTYPDVIVDGWQKPLRYPPFDNTSANPNEHYFGDEGEGLPRQRAPYVASAGPDQEWGTFTQATPTSPWVPDAAAADNIYSFEQE